MAKEYITKVTDDIDGADGAKTFKLLDLDGREYEIDLAPKNAGKLEVALAPYIKAATPITPARRRANPNGRAKTDKEQNAAIRRWAEKKGLDVAPRGRIRAEIVEQYHREAGR